MNTLEPIIAFIDERIKQLKRLVKAAKTHADLDVLEARVQELMMIRTLCTGLISQDKLLQKALAV